MMRISLALLLFVAPASALTVEEAYKAIPHKQTQYEASSSTVPAEVTQYLVKLFALSDRALVERISTMQAFIAKDTARFSHYESSIQKIMNEIDQLPEPAAAQGLGALLKSAVSSQRSYFIEWHASLTGGQPMPQGLNPKIAAASGSLQRLYGELMRRFPQESAHNKDAFYQHLCALDFI